MALVEDTERLGSSDVLVSVVVAAYNVEDYLASCLDSIARQSHERLQVIVVDDGATDATGRICDEFARRDARFEVVHQENAGLSCARNAGLARAVGDYVTFVDGDDRLAPMFAEELLMAALKNDAQIAVSDYKRIRNKDDFAGETRQGEQVVSGREAARMVVGCGERFMITAWGKLYAKDLWPLLVYPAGKVNEDEFVTYRVMYATARVALVASALYGYTLRPGSIMGTLGLESLDALEALQEAADYFVEAGDADLAAWARKRYAFHIMACYYRVAMSQESSPAVLADLKRLFDVFMRTHGDEVRPRADALLRFQLKVFQKSPAAYVRMARLWQAGSSAANAVASIRPRA